MKLDNRGGVCLLKGGYVCNEKCVDIMSFFSTRFIDLWIREYSVVNYLIYCCARIMFLGVFTSNNHISDFSIKYVGSSQITKGIVMSRSIRPEFMVSRWMFIIGTSPVCSRNSFCWTVWFFTVVASVVWMSPRGEGVKWIWELEGSIGSNTEACMKIDLSSVVW